MPISTASAARIRAPERPTSGTVGRVGATDATRLTAKSFSTASELERALSRHVWAPALVGLLLASVIVGGRLILSGGDPSTFVRAGGARVDPSRVPASLHLVPPSGVYDGQFFYRLALDPLAIRDVGIELDGPAYRHQRVLYPALVWTLSLGQPELAAWLLPTVNVLGLVLLGLMAGQFCRELGEPAWWGAALPLYAGFTYSLARDLDEITLACCVLASLLFVQRRRYAWAAVLLALAVIARETAVLLAGGLILASLRARYSGRRPVPPLYVGVVGVASYVAVQFALWLRWGQVPLLAGGGEINPGPPFAAPLQYALSVGRLGRIELGVFVGVLLLALTTPRAPLHLRLGLLMYVCLLSVLSWAVWEGDAGWLRAATEANVLAWLLLFHAVRVRPVCALLATSTLWPAAARWAIAT